jgi:hypothetical protein
MLTALACSTANNGNNARRDELEILKQEIISASGSGLTWDATVLNNSSKTVTGIIWKVQLYDRLRQVKVDEFYVLSQRSALSSAEELIIPPGGKQVLGVTFVNHSRYPWQDHYSANISVARLVNSPYRFGTSTSAKEYILLEGEIP